MEREIQRILNTGVLLSILGSLGACGPIFSRPGDTQINAATSAATLVVRDPHDCSGVVLDHEMPIIGPQWCELASLQSQFTVNKDGVEVRTIDAGHGKAFLPMSADGVIFIFTEDGSVSGVVNIGISSLINPKVLPTLEVCRENGNCQRVKPSDRSSITIPTEHVWGFVYIDADGNEIRVPFTVDTWTKSYLTRSDLMPVMPFDDTSWCAPVPGCGSYYGDARAIDVIALIVDDAPVGLNYNQGVPIDR